jgi:hypothetical protein
MNPIEGEERAARAEKLARLAETCRQVSGMMEAGVDILRITRVVRSQTEDNDILRLCERIDYDLKRGRAISDALADEPDLFSPFAVTLVRQGEERSNLAQAFARVAQAFDHERQELQQTQASSVAASASASPESRATPSQVLESHFSSPQAPGNAPESSWPALGTWLEQAEARWLRTASGVGAGILAASAASEALVALGVLPHKWQRPLMRALSAGVLAAAALGSRKDEAQRSPNSPQVLAPASEPTVTPTAAQDQDTDFSPAPLAAPEVREPPAVAVPEEPASNAVYTGAPRDDEEEVRRTVRRPPHEEEFD